MERENPIPVSQIGSQSEDSSLSRLCRVALLVVM